MAAHQAVFADVMLLGVDCFRKNRPGDAEIPMLGPDGLFDSRMIRIADLKGNLCVHPEADETFPRLKSQQRGVLQQLFSNNDPVIQRALTEPANLGYIKNVLGLTEMVIPGEDSRNKQLREIQQLLASAPIIVSMHPSGAVHVAPMQAAADAANSETHDSRASGAVATVPLVLPSVPVDLLFDDHAVELEECKRWANSDAGQVARMTNPTGFENVHAHAEAHLRALQQAAISAAVMSAGPSANPAGTTVRGANTKPSHSEPKAQ